MTENEKLRALLAEAQKAIPQAWNGRNGKWCEEVQARIDAALAEPVAVHPSSLTDVVTLLENEREEVRAEVERLKEANRLLHHDADKEWGAAATAIAAAYQRGAEAMREAAASAVHDCHTTGLLSPAAVTAAVRVIQRLPIPEDKP